MDVKANLADHRQLSIWYQVFRRLPRDDSQCASFSHACEIITRATSTARQGSEGIPQQRATRSFFDFEMEFQISYRKACAIEPRAIVGGLARFEGVPKLSSPRKGLAVCRKRDLPRAQARQAHSLADL